MVCSTSALSLYAYRCDHIQLWERSCAIVRIVWRRIGRGIVRWQMGKDRFTCSDGVGVLHPRGHGSGLSFLAGLDFDLRIGRQQSKGGSKNYRGHFRCICRNGIGLFRNCFSRTSPEVARIRIGPYRLVVVDWKCDFSFFLQVS